MLARKSGARLLLSSIGQGALDVSMMQKLIEARISGRISSISEYLRPSGLEKDKRQTAHGLRREFEKLKATLKDGSPSWLDSSLLIIEVLEDKMREAGIKFPGQAGSNAGGFGRQQPLGPDRLP